MSDTQSISIPADLLPKDGRFGAGPSKVRPEQVDALVAAGRNLLGTSHRQAPVKNLVGSVREGLREFFKAPAGYEIILGVGGSTAFWDVASFGLVERKAQHLSFGEFSSKFAAATNKAPFLAESSIITAEPGSRPEPRAEAGVDVYAGRRMKPPPVSPLRCSVWKVPTTALWFSSTPPRLPAGWP